MDLSQALLPGILVFALVSAIDVATGRKLASAIKVPLAFVLGVAFVALTAASDFGHTQLVQELPLDELNFASQAIVGLLVGAAAVGFDQGFKAIGNIGQNRTIDAVSRDVTNTHRS